jgi:hypothetical protein
MLLSSILSILLSCQNRGSHTVGYATIFANCCIWRETTGDSKPLAKPQSPPRKNGRDTQRLGRGRQTVDIRRARLNSPLRRQRLGETIWNSKNGMGLTKSRLLKPRVTAGFPGQALHVGGLYGGEARARGGFGPCRQPCLPVLADPAQREQNPLVGVETAATFHGQGVRHGASRKARTRPDWLMPPCYLRSMCFTGISRRPNISTAAWDCSKIT